MGAPRLAYLADALGDLAASLSERGARLVVRRGRPEEVVPAVAQESAAAAVHWSADHTPYARRRDAEVARRLDAAGRDAHAHPGVAIHPPEAVRTAAGGPYRVFSPFHRTWQGLPIADALPAPDRLPHAPVPDGDGPPELGDLLRPLDGARAALPEEPLPRGGETPARERLERFLADGAAGYHERRDLLAVAGTSRLSADLKYGCLSPRAVLAPLDRRKPGHDALARELAWRDFALHVLAAWPEAARTAFDPRLRSLPWHGDGEDAEAWRQGLTGYPIVDAGMRQLRREGWVHNRARMVVASFLCKDLLVDWRIGEAHFLQHLVDGDVASNNLGWQWAAGTGTDAQPFVRIFNPVRQGERFDPDGAYVRRHVPELAPVPTRWIHQPWAMPEDVAAGCGVRIGVDYPAPIVDHAEARRAAIAWFEAHTR
jgi:deoxyribodipyrimidine photo-lyase